MTAPDEIIRQIEDMIRSAPTKQEIRESLSRNNSRSNSRRGSHGGHKEIDQFEPISMRPTQFIDKNEQSAMQQNTSAQFQERQKTNITIEEYDEVQKENTALRQQVKRVAKQRISTLLEKDWLSYDECLGFIDRVLRQ